LIVDYFNNKKQVKAEKNKINQQTKEKKNNKKTNKTKQNRTKTNKQINVREYRRGNQKWTNHRN
jgi:hypothetical protein